MEMEVVTRRGWLTRADFLDLLGVVQVLPGPNSTELAIHIGHVRGGWRGGIVAGVFFCVAERGDGVVACECGIGAGVATEDDCGDVVASVAVPGRAIAGFAILLVGWQFFGCLLAVLLLFVGRVQATIMLLGAVSAGIVAALFHFSPS